MCILALTEGTLSVKVQFEIFLESESDLKYFGQQHFRESKGSILLYSIVFCFIGRILCVLGQTSFCGEVGFGIWLKNFPWCFKAKFPPLRRRLFVINFTTVVFLQVPRFVSVQCTPLGNFSVVFESQIPNPTSPQKDICD